MPWPAHPCVLPCHQLYIKGAKLLEVAKPSPRAPRSTLQVHVMWQRKSQMHAQSNLLSIKRRLQLCVRATYTRTCNHMMRGRASLVDVCAPYSHQNMWALALTVTYPQSSSGIKTCPEARNNVQHRDSKTVRTAIFKSRDGLICHSVCLVAPQVIRSQLYDCYLNDELRKGLGGRFT